ncbi:MAG TPA: amidase [Steroidobacteraceae bacterium]|jgi:Asp-tRNA(Asn)/Glu-tRNA(Gln) amidotransferase A subunit family amidase
MAKSRREFLVSSAALVGAGAGRSHAATKHPTTPGSLPLGSPPVFGTATGVGPEVTAATIAEAEKLVRVKMTPADRTQAASNWRDAMAPVYERRTGPRRVDLEPGLAPYSRCNPLLSGEGPTPRPDQFIGSGRDPGPLPADDADIAFAPLWKLARWVQSRQLRSERLTALYLQRIQTYDPRLKCVITVTHDLALEQARRADQEIAAGHYRGPLHGIPWGGKDLLDTAGIRTTYGAEPFRDRVPAKDAAVVQRLREAGAVLIAKLSMGALALNDIWFGGQTMNPWLLEEGSGGSSAGPGAATAAGLVGFSIGSETEGSIVDPSTRCGVCGLRPTFGRVPRTGAMTLCWSLDKLGPIARSVEDTILVLRAISGPDPGDLSSVPSVLDFDARANVRGLRVGYFPRWQHEATEVDRHALQQLRSLGLDPVEVALPDWPYDSLNAILFAESAAAFEELTLSGKLDQLRAQTPDAWPNTFRQSRFISAVDFVQADRFRRAVAQEMAKLFSQVDLLLVPSLRDEMLTIGNFTGYPSLTLRAGFIEVTEARSDWAPDPHHPLPRFDPPRRVPQSVTLVGRLFDEGTIARVGLALEHALGVEDDRPPGFAGLT